MIIGIGITVILCMIATNFTDWNKAQDMADIWCGSDSGLKVQSFSEVCESDNSEVPPPSGIGNESENKEKSLVPRDYFRARWAFENYNAPLSIDLMRYIHQKHDHSRWCMMPICLYIYFAVIHLGSHPVAVVQTSLKTH